MTKQIIKEKELITIIKESVVKVLNELSPGLLQKAADKAYDIGRYSQAENLQQGAEDACTETYGINGTLKASPKAIFWINGRYSCSLSRDARFCTRSSNYFADVPTTRGYIQSSIPKEMKVKDIKIARLIAKWWNQYGEEDIPMLSDWHSFVDYGN